MMFERSDRWTKIWMNELMDGNPTPKQPLNTINLPPLSSSIHALRPLRTSFTCKLVSLSCLSNLAD